jgi:DNA-directed RNA polymerase subunit beta'
MVEDRVPVARDELNLETRERPVFVNRAPSLSRFNLVAGYPKLVTGKTILLNPFAEKGMNADYDGDAVQIHAPVTAAGVADVKKMTLSHLIFSDRKPGTLNVAPDMEAILGLHRATEHTSDAKSTSFASHKDALEAYHQGKIGLQDTIKIAP